MFSVKISFVLTLFIVGSLQQEATFKCEQEDSYRLFGIGHVPMSSYYDGIKYRCSFENVKSSEDIMKAQKKSSTLTTRVTTIIFLNSSLSQLPDKMFATYPNVKTLDASRLVLSEISPSAFFDIKFWYSMDLSSNNIKTLAARTFATMQIKSLDLSQNLLETIDDKAFLNADIEKINLSFNKLKSSLFLNSFSYFNLVQLTNNLLENFNGIEVKKDGWSNRRGIFTTEQEYPKFYLQENKLKKIDCSSNIKITSLGVENNSLLTEINLNECLIDELDVSNCANLKKLSFNDNLLGFTAKNVKLSDADLLTAKSLTSLSLANSSLSQTQFDEIMKMENLTFLDLSYNNIGSLNVSTFAKLKALEFLLLKATNVSNIQFGTFSHQHSVKQFDISDNNLGFFDMNMIFSMTSLLTLDISGNKLTSLKNFESAHFTFTLLQKIDLSNNNWPCNYLLRLIKVFRVYKVTLSTSNIEETSNSIHGIGCISDDIDVNLIEPLSPDSLNVTDIRDKMNELIDEVSKNTQFRTNIELRLQRVESKVDNQNQVNSAAFRSEKLQNIEVKNSTLLESALVIVCICFTLFMALKISVYIRDNFLRRSRPMRMDSERTLAMTVDDF